MRDKLELLQRRRAESELGGGEARLKAQHEKGKLSARERLDLLLDEGSFVELDRFVVHRSTDFGLDAQKFYGDGARYEVIFSANSAQIRNPNLIYPGQTFVVPRPGPKP